MPCPKYIIHDELQKVKNTRLQAVVWCLRGDTTEVNRNAEKGWYETTFETWGLVHNSSPMPWVRNKQEGNAVSIPASAYTVYCHQGQQVFTILKLKHMAKIHSQTDRQTDRHFHLPLNVSKTMSNSTLLWIVAIFWATNTLPHNTENQTS